VTGTFLDVATADLRDALRRIEHGHVAAPWSDALRFELPAVSHAIAPLGVGSGLDTAPASAMVALLRAILAEREARPPPAEIVWTGPEPLSAASRDTMAVVAGMFRDARDDVVLSTYSLDLASVLFEPLHEAMRDRGVVARIFYDLAQCARTVSKSTPTGDASYAAFFHSHFWPFGPPFPKLYYDPRALEGGSPCSLHAKLVVVDRRFLLVGSANLTDRGQTRNVELGLKLDDRRLAERVVDHWVGCVSRGMFHEAR
jgi:hypothetical protein